MERDVTSAAWLAIMPGRRARERQCPLKVPQTTCSGLAPARERHGRFRSVLRREHCSSRSARQYEPILIKADVANDGPRRRAGSSSAVRQSVLFRTFGVRFRASFDVDFVAHTGPSAAGAIVQTMVLTDIATSVRSEHGL